MMPDPNKPGTIRFDGFEINIQSKELRRDGELVKLQPQPFKILMLLVEHAGQMVSRQQLRDAIWGEETFVDFDKGLNLGIAQIREALGDNAQAPQFIETLSRRGYRFVAAVEPPENLRAGVAAKSATELSDIGNGAGSKPVRGRFVRQTVAYLALAIILVSTAAAAIYYYRIKGAIVSRPDARAKSMLLVLPLENLTDDPAQEYFSDGLTEELITRLGSMQPRSLGVIARTTALKYKRSGKDIRQIGDELGVEYVLEGSVRRDAGRIRISSQLIQVKDQTHVWAETFDRSETDILDIQREVATRVATALRLELIPSSNGESANKTANPEAYDAYLKGRFMITKDTQEDLERSVPLFDQAIAIDPNFAPAYAAEVEALVLQNDWSGKLRAANASKAKTAALKAVELDPTYAESFASLASAQLWLEWDLPGAEVNFQRAVELNPNNPLTRINYGRCLFAKGDRVAAVSEINEALKLDPVGLLTTGLAAYARLQVGDYDEAIALSNRMLELEPKSPAARECLFRAYVNQGNFAEALKMFRQRMSMNGAKADEIGHLDGGEPKEVFDAMFRKSLSEMQASAAKGGEVWTMYAAWLSVKTGDNDKAFAWLDRAVSEHASFVIYLAVDPAWTPLRSDPRFDALRQRVGI